jgi:DNA modification methylase
VDPVIVRGYIGDSGEAKLYYGLDVSEGLKLLPDASVHMVATSPPYWGLRDYGVEGQLGSEETLEEYVARLVKVFREVARVLRPDGTLWLNLGDSYVSSPTGNMGTKSKLHEAYTSETYTSTIENQYTKRSRPPTPSNLKPKDLVGIPWRVALALQADGWYLRSDIVWAKSACMPESIRDRPTRAHEYVFLFAHPDSGGRYFYDADAIREGSHTHTRKGTKGGHKLTQMGGYKGLAGGTLKRDPDEPYGFARDITTVGRNKRSWWNINPKPYKGAHFAVWPPKLVEPMIKAGTSEKGCCPTCGSQWERVVEKVIPTDPGRSEDAQHVQAADQLSARAASTGARRLGQAYQDQLDKNPSKTIGWRPTCECPEHKPVRAVVLDPFSGSATTGMVALGIRRDYIGIDLNEDDLPMAQARILDEPAPEKGESTPTEGVFALFGEEG